MTLNYRELRWDLIGAALLLSLIGILLIMSAQYHSDSEYRQHYYLRQALWLAIAFIGFAVIVHLPLRLFDVSAYFVYGIAIGLLVLVLMFGSGRAATRWISFGPVNLAPADVAKFGVLLALSRYFAATRRPPQSKRRLGLSLLFVVIPVALILKQPDLGTSLVFWVLLLALWFWSGLSPWFLVLILSPIASLLTALSPEFGIEISQWIPWTVYLISLLVLLFVLRPGLVFSVLVVVANLATGSIGPLVWDRLARYQQMRIISFIDPSEDPQGAGYQIIQSKIAVGSGGLFGQGFLAGSQARLEYLPERHTDFIFSVLAEEFGLIGGLIVMILFAYIFYRGIVIASRCRSRFASTIAFGAVTILMFQFFINIGMALGFMPVTGLPLPFLSYGGTSLVLTWALVGLIVLADYHWQEY